MRAALRAGEQRGEKLLQPQPSLRCHSEFVPVERRRGLRTELWATQQVETKRKEEGGGQEAMRPGPRHEGCDAWGLQWTDTNKPD